ncbi:alpha/beta hydrolase [Myxococcus sp. CA056]|uniref:alpha/beta fold hydrolase n=1 Tax=Myxococcus sp. CA056 TaxID=2741740 RepID=UPI00157AE6B2|nr:alpha/beta hydrolase [Myxococcus sp. CA056]NTX17306.1 alpha/beta hydrolase [Myxococcus sp. CA056]
MRTPPSVPLDARLRAEAPGRFIALSDGQTHYLLDGPEGGSAVVLIPGATLPLFIWEPLVEPLVRAGHRVLRYDLFGRGYSDRPKVRYGPELYERQLTELLAALGLHAPVHLVGLAFGGLLAVQYVDRNPERVRSLCLIEPDGFGTKLSLGVRLMHVPVLGEALFAVMGERQLRARLPGYSRRPELIPELEARFLPSTRIAGFGHALLSTLRHMAIHTAAPVFHRVARRHIPTLLLWGRDDRITPLHIAEEVHAALPHAEFHIIDDAGHLPHYERPAAVAPLLTEFLAKPRPAA